GGEQAALDRVHRLAAGPRLLLDQRPLDAAVDDADRHPLAGGPGVAQDGLRPEQVEEAGERVGGDAVVGGPGARRRVVHGGPPHVPVPVTASSSSRRLVTSWAQWRTAGVPWRRASTRMASTRRSVSSASTAAPGVALRPSRSWSRTAVGGGSSSRSA